MKGTKPQARRALSEANYQLITVAISFPGLCSPNQGSAGGASELCLPGPL